MSVFFPLFSPFFFPVSHFFLKARKWKSVPKSHFKFFRFFWHNFSVLPRKRKREKKGGKYPHVYNGPKDTSLRGSFYARFPESSQLHLARFPRQILVSAMVLSQWIRRRRTLSSCFSCLLHGNIYAHTSKYLFSLFKGFAPTTEQKPRERVCNMSY